MAVRSKRLVATTLTTSVVTKYTAGASETVLVKWLSIYNPNGAARTITLAGVLGGAARTWLIEAVPTLECRRFDVWLVLQPGDTITAKQDTGSDVQLVIAGAELEGVAD